MQARGWLALRALLNRYHRGSAESFLKGLSKDDSQMILAQDVQSQDIFPLINIAPDNIAKIHFSWLSTEIKKFSSPIDRFIIASLPEKQANSLYQTLKKERVEGPLSEPVRNYFIHLLYSKIDEKTVLPLAYLPASDLNVLTEMSKADLVQICDYLALQDLAEAVRFIVDKKKLSHIYQWLSPGKKQYLKICLHQRDKLPVPKLELERWDENFEQLEDILHKRGLIRFAKALSGQHPDLIWHITHILDTGRAAVINKYYTKESIPKITPTLTQHLTNLLNFLKPKSTP